MSQTIFSQIVSFLPKREFQRCVTRYEGNKNTRTFSCWDQFLCMLFAQLTYRESLRDIEACLRSIGTKLYHLGILGNVSRSTLAYANDSRDWRIFADFGQHIIKKALKLVPNHQLLVPGSTIYALDATVIDTCLSLLPWTAYRTRSKKGGMKIHTLLDVGRNIPTFINITEQKVYELAVSDLVNFEPAAFYIFDRGYFDWTRFYRITLSGAFFVTRTKTDCRFNHVSSSPILDPLSGVKSDHIVRMKKPKQTPRKYPERLRKIRFQDALTKKYFTFLTNNFLLPPETIAALYKSRWNIELFFKWLKQHLRIKSFYGYSMNAVKTQTWIAITSFVLIAIIKERLKLPKSPYEILQIFSITVFEKTPILSVFQQQHLSSKNRNLSNQLNLFNDCVGH